MTEMSLSARILIFKNVIINTFPTVNQTDILLKKTLSSKACMYIIVRQSSVLFGFCFGLFIYSSGIEWPAWNKDDAFMVVWFAALFKEWFMFSCNDL